MRTSRFVLFGSAILGVSIVLYFVVQLLLSGPDTANLLTAQVTRGNLEQTVEASGTLQPKELVSVGAQVSGRIEVLEVEVGDTVRQGQLIAQIDAQQQTNSLQSTRAELANMQAQRASRQAALVRTEQELRRQEIMVPGEATSTADYEAARAERDAARAERDAVDAQIRQARLSVDTAGINLGYTKILAPMDGVVVAVVTKQGQTVNANQSAPTIVILAKLDVMEVRAEISEADVIKVEPGLPVYFTILGDFEHRYEASLLQIEPAPESIVNEVDSSTSSSSTASAIYYNALFEVPNTDGRLRALMTAQVTIVLAQRQNALLIPSSALGEKDKDGRYAVQVLDAEGRVATRQVRIGLNNNASAEVLDGLALGEKVVIGEASTAPAGGGDARQMGGPPF